MAAPDTRFDTTHYVPVLKCKMGEFGALRWMQPGSRNRTVPLIELFPEKVAELGKAWGDGLNITYVQLLGTDELDPSAEAEQLEEVFAALRDAAVLAVPTATTDEPNEVLVAMGAAAKAVGHGVCVRLESERFALETPGVVGALVQRLLDLTDSAPDDCDLVIDCGFVRDSLVARVTTVEGVLRVLPHFAEWRNVTVAFSAFPEGLAEVATKSSITPILREDSHAFQRLVDREPGRVLVYGDYGIGVPFYFEGQAFAPIPAIRYATGDTWMIHRAATKADPSIQYVQLARDVQSQSYFDGASFSGGDAYINDVADGSDGPGNAMTYVRAAASRHFEVVLDRLATLGVP